MIMCLERGADLHMARLMPLPLTVSCFSDIQIAFTFLVPAHPGKRAVKWVCVCVCCINRLLCGPLYVAYNYGKVVKLFAAQNDPFASSDVAGMKSPINVCL